MTPETAQDPRSLSQAKTPASVVWAIIAVSIVASLFICWLVYVHTPIDAAGNRFPYLPRVNAILNACATVALLFGYAAIRRRDIAAHRTSMFTAFFFSSIFLVCYLATFFLHGETHLHIAHSGALWMTYAIVLFATHIPLAVVCLPLILITFFLSLTGRIPQHRKVARWTFPIWLYVSVSGVFVYLLQAIVNR